MFKNGRIAEIQGFRPGNKAMLYYSADLLRCIFEYNATLLKVIGVSSNKQRAELLSMYGIRISANIFSEIRRGKRYTTGWLLVAGLKHYWLQKGYELKLDR